MIGPLNFVMFSSVQYISGIVKQFLGRVTTEFISLFG